MDTKQFIASLISSLAWPGAVIAVVLLFRKQLAGLLTGGPLKRLKAGPVELEFDRIAATVEARLEVAEPGAAEAPPAPAGVAQIEGVRDAARQALHGSALRDLAERAQVWPPGAVIEGFMLVEAELRELVEAAEESSDGFRLGAAQLARRAVQHGVITPSTAEAVDGIAVMRNLVAHGGEREVTEERAIDYLTLVDGVLFAIRRDAKEWQQGSQLTGQSGTAVPPSTDADTF
ncbi:MAG TPA: hypothetical protein VFW38_04165 [Solirubrobacteraceae bacterium]|nr:hypothetical protein [Solirubrobacteraceae bacterium]